MIIYTIDASLFLVLDAIIFQQALKMKSSYSNELQIINTSVSHRTRIYFILLCLIANLMRTTSIVLLDVISPVKERPNFDLVEGNEVVKWFQDILRTFPSLIYMSSYSVVALFWAHVYYSSTFTNVPYIMAVFLLGNSLVYGIYISGMIVSFYNSSCYFSVLSSLILSITHTIISMLLFYYGLKVAIHLSRRASAGAILRYNVIKRVLFLTIFCPALLFIRGVISGIQCFCSFSEIQINLRLLDKNPTGDTFIFILTELVPSIITMVSFWQKISPPLIFSDRGLGLSSIFSQTSYFNDYRPKSTSTHFSQNLCFPKTLNSFPDK